LAEAEREQKHDQSKNKRLTAHPDFKNVIVSHTRTQNDRLEQTANIDRTLGLQ